MRCTFIEILDGIVFSVAGGEKKNIYIYGTPKKLNRKKIDNKFCSYLFEPKAKFLKIFISHPCIEFHPIQQKNKRRWRKFFIDDEYIYSYFIYIVN